MNTQELLNCVVAGAEDGVRFIRCWNFRADLSMEHPDLRLPIIDIKADWPAFVELTGLRTWSHSLHCCPCCMVTKKELTELGGFTQNTCKHEPFDQHLYAATVEANFRVPPVFKECTMLVCFPLLRYAVILDICYCRGLCLQGC